MKALRWVDVGRIEDLRFAPGAPVRIGERFVAIFRLDGQDPAQRYVAIDNPCPHAGAPLCDGTVRDGKVICFLHCWEFDLRTGACDVGHEWDVATHPVREIDGRLEVGVEQDESRSGTGLPS